MSLLLSYRPLYPFFAFAFHRETKSLAEARRAEMDVHTAMGLYARREAVQVYAKARE